MQLFEKNIIFRPISVIGLDFIYQGLNQGILYVTFRDIRILVLSPSSANEIAIVLAKSGASCAVASDY